MFILTFLLISLACNALAGKFANNQLPGRTTIVHLFEWKWLDIADECERFLGPKGFGGIQISPPSENLIIYTDNGTRPWWERYQVMSYNLTTRSGNEEDFKIMTRRCNDAGVRIYADVVMNHMTADHDKNIGTGGSTADFENYTYPAVPYKLKHFHYPHCGIETYDDADQVRNCELLGLKDLNQTDEYVRGKLADYYNKLIEFGVAGFRVDAAKHMSPSDLKEIYSRLNNLNPKYGFPPNSTPYIYQEVIYYGDGAVSPDEYIPLGAVTEFRVGEELKNCFRGQNDLKFLVNWGEEWGLSPNDTALTFIDNHDTQRSNDVLTYKEARAYKAAIAFILAHPYGEPSLMSSYYFEEADQGPPFDCNEDIVSPSILQNETCGNGWVCEHRWPQIYQMVAFRNVAGDTDVENWWDNGGNQIAFSRGDRAFIVFNLDESDLEEELQTGLPPGQYCDVIAGTKEGIKCTGRTVEVGEDGVAKIELPYDKEDMHLAIHVGFESRLPVKFSQSISDNSHKLTSTEA